MTLRLSGAFYFEACVALPGRKKHQEEEILIMSLSAKERVLRYLYKEKIVRTVQFSDILCVQPNIVDDTEFTIYLNTGELPLEHAVEARKDRDSVAYLLSRLLHRKAVKEYGFPRPTTLYAVDAKKQGKFVKADRYLVLQQYRLLVYRTRASGSRGGFPLNVLFLTSAKVDAKGSTGLKVRCKRRDYYFVFEVHRQREEFLDVLRQQCIAAQERAVPAGSAKHKADPKVIRALSRRQGPSSKKKPPNKRQGTRTTANTRKKATPKEVKSSPAPAAPRQGSDPPPPPAVAPSSSSSSSAKGHRTTLSTRSRPMTTTAPPEHSDSSDTDDGGGDEEEEVESDMPPPPPPSAAAAAEAPPPPQQPEQRPLPFPSSDATEVVPPPPPDEALPPPPTTGDDAEDMPPPPDMDAPPPPPTTDVSVPPPPTAAGAVSVSSGADDATAAVHRVSMPPPPPRPELPASPSPQPVPVVDVDAPPPDLRPRLPSEEPPPKPPSTPPPVVGAAPSTTTTAATVTTTSAAGTAGAGQEEDSVSAVAAADTNDPDVSTETVGARDEEKEEEARPMSELAMELAVAARLPLDIPVSIRGASAPLGYLSFMEDDVSLSAIRERMQATWGTLCPGKFQFVYLGSPVRESSEGTYFASLFPNGLIIDATYSPSQLEQLAKFNPAGIDVPQSLDASLQPPSAASRSASPSPTASPQLLPRASPAGTDEPPELSVLTLTVVRLLRDHGTTPVSADSKNHQPASVGVDDTTDTAGSMSRGPAEEAVGMLELEEWQSTTLADIRQMIVDELDDVADNFAFVWNGIPVGRRQEAKKKISQYPKETPLYIRERPNRMVSEVPVEAKMGALSAKRTRTRLAPIPAAPPADERELVRRRPAGPAHSSTASVGGSSLANRIRLGLHKSTPSTVSLGDEVQQARTNLRSIKLPPRVTQLTTPKQVGVMAALSEALLKRREHMTELGRANKVSISERSRGDTFVWSDSSSESGGDDDAE